MLCFYFSHATSRSKYTTFLFLIMTPYMWQQLMSPINVSVIAGYPKTTRTPGDDSFEEPLSSGVSFCITA